MGKKAKHEPEIEVHEGIDAVEAFRALLNRLDSGESELAGVEVNGFDDDDDVVLTVRLYELEGGTKQLEFQRGPKSNELSIDDLRRLGEALVKQAAMLFDMADEWDVAETEGDEDE